jgi:hypothetical protein
VYIVNLSMCADLKSLMLETIFVRIKFCAFIDNFHIYQVCESKLLRSTSVVLKDEYKYNF